MYMRRRNFKWDRETRNYKPVETKMTQATQLNAEVHTGKVAQIIAAFEVNSDPKEVAQEFGFKDHKELAKYMSRKGYEWNMGESNYVRVLGVKQANETEVDASKAELNDEKQKRLNKCSVNNEELAIIIKQLSAILPPEENPMIDRVPRYLIKGIAKNKTVPISHLLHQLIEGFSEENHITHREIFEVALIDFFKKYGYQYEVEILFKND